MAASGLADPRVSTRVGCLVCSDWAAGRTTSPAAPPHFFRPESRQDYPPNLSILISGGKENNCDAPSNGE